jgi:hypothetical protein
LRSHGLCRLNVLFAVKAESNESLSIAISRSTVAFIVIGVGVIRHAGLIGSHMCLSEARTRKFAASPNSAQAWPLLLSRANLANLKER